MDEQTQDQIKTFLAWSAAVDRSEMIITYKAYIRMTGSRCAADLLAAIVYWHTPAKNGETRLRVEQDGLLWFAKSRAELAEEIYCSEKEIRGAERALETLGIVMRRNYHFKGANTGHYRLNWEKFLERWAKAVKVDEIDLAAVIGYTARPMPGMPPPTPPKKVVASKRRKREPITLPNGAKAVDHPANVAYFEAAGTNIPRLWLVEICNLFEQAGAEKFEAVLKTAQGRYGHLTNFELIRDWLAGGIPDWASRQPSKLTESKDSGAPPPELEKQWQAAKGNSDEL